VVAGLTQPLGIIAAKPELFFVPDDPKLAEYRPDFANQVCMLEDRFASYGGAKTKSSSELFSEMLKKNNHRPYEPDVLRARLLDMLVGDYDRHFGQWQWSVGDTGAGKIYYPIPRDRDQAFFNSDGLSMKLVGGRVMKFLKGFQPEIKDPDWLGYTAKDFDRVFLTSLDEDAWKNAVGGFTSKLSDSVIRSAVNRLPPEIFAIDGENMVSKLISRRNEMGQKAMEYYEFISRKVNIVGSNLKEYFKVSNYGQGLQVRVYARKGSDTSFIMYNRIFHPSVTKEIRLFGLNDDDMFEIEENATSVIKLRIIGGKGNDTFDIKGGVENLLYDRKGDLNVIKNSSRSKNRFTTDVPADDSRNILGFEYNTTSFPQLLFGYNYDDGYFTGVSLTKITRGFRNLPYATNQRFAFLYAFRNAYQFDYKGVFNHITRNKDLLVNAKFSSPVIRNFFGLGNKTSTDGVKNFDYFRIRYKELEVEALLRKRFFERLNLFFGPRFYQYQSDFKDNSHNILSNWQSLGIDSPFTKKSYFGAKAGFSFSNQNHDLFPTRGLNWNTEIVSLFGMKSGSRNFTSFTSDMTIHASLRDPSRVVAVIKFGGGHIFGKKYEYFQALNIGANNSLNGFRKNRYAGGSMAYGSLEFRIKLLDINSYILPGPFGVTAFYDAARVWVKQERAKNWHGAYGFGFYFIPFNHFLISGSAGFSEKEKSLNFSLGSKFNITF